MAIPNFIWNSKAAVPKFEAAGYCDFTKSGEVAYTTLTGTVTLTNGSTTVSGSGTLFLSELQVGDLIKLESDDCTAWAKIASITDDVTATLEAAYTGAGGSGTAHISRDGKIQVSDPSVTTIPADLDTKKWDGSNIVDRAAAEIAEVKRYLDVTASDSSIPAGTGSTTITVQLRDGDGNALARDGVTVNFSTTDGALSALSATTDANGQASVTLTASDETVTAKVTATADGYKSGFAQVQFTP